MPLCLGEFFIVLDLGYFGPQGAVTEGNVAVSFQLATTVRRHIEIT